MKKAIHLLYSGKVQGVGFRFTVKSIADKYGLNGWVKNLSNGKVEALLQGEELNVDACLKAIEQYFIDNIRDIKTNEEAYMELFGFQIRH